MLSCSCNYDYEWFYDSPSDFIKLNTKRRRRCLSCNKLIDVGSDCLQFYSYRIPYDEIEERIHGDEVPMAYRYMCEKCGEIFLNLNDLGYCLSLGTTSMQEYLDDYWEMTGFTPKSDAESELCQS